MIFLSLPLQLALQVVLLLLSPEPSKAQSTAASTVVHVRYGYFTEPRGGHVACARRWLDLYDAPSDTYYQVSCHPQSSGRVAAARLDRNQLQLAHLGSTPLAEALARRVDIQTVFLTQYGGDSQGIYVRSALDEKATPDRHIATPLDLADHTLGVPFGSTIHYQVLFLLDLLGLTGKVEVLDLSPTQIIQAWDSGKVDAVACWGAARDHVLQLSSSSPSNGDEVSEGQRRFPADTLVTARVLSDWGRPTFTALAVATEFGRQHTRFLTHVVKVQSELHDSYLDRLGGISPSNVPRWDATNAGASSYVASMVDALMINGETPGNPSAVKINAQRRAMDDFVEVSAEEQIGCAYFGDATAPLCSPQPNKLLGELQQTVDFLYDQKLLADNSTLALEDSINGTYLQLAYEACFECHPVGRYAEQQTNAYVSGEAFALLDKFDALDSAPVDNETLLFATPFEVGRANRGDGSKRSDSTCQELWADLGALEGTSSPITGTIGDGANGESNKTYGDNMNCALVVRAVDCVSSDPAAEVLSSAGNVCQRQVKIEVDRMRLWGGDVLRFYTDPQDALCSNRDSPSRILLAQYSGVYDTSPTPLLPVVAQGCVLVELSTDGNTERSYNDRSDNSGDGILLSYDRDYEGAVDDSSSLAHCVGTKVVEFDFRSDDPQIITSGLESDIDVLDDGVFYPNSLDCSWELRATNIDNSGGPLFFKVVLMYSLEKTFDVLFLNTGPVNAVADKGTYVKLTGPPVIKSMNGGPELQRETYHLPMDEDGIAHMRLQTDSMGRRHGFLAKVEVVFLRPQEIACNKPGLFGNRCEISHCSDESPFFESLDQDISESYRLGRVVSQKDGMPVSTIPLGGCNWRAKNIYANAQAFRLAFHRPFDLEPHQIDSIGDKLTVEVAGRDSVHRVDLFVEKCDSDEVCSFPWQTGECNKLGHCDIKSVVEVPIPIGTRRPAAANLLLTNDRNDRGIDYGGLDFDLQVVDSCPSNIDHCENDNKNRCVDDLCICSGGIPCGCSCEGDLPLVLKSTSTALAIGIIVPTVVIFILVFCLYRRKKLQASRLRKQIIAEQEAELDGFRKFLDMRSAKTEYFPIVKDDLRKSVMRASGVFSLKYFGSSLELETASKTPVVWCWQETKCMMDNHDDKDIFGDPSKCYIKYDPATNDSLEQAFQVQNGQGSFSLDMYTVCFDTMIQTKDSTGFQRNVKRVVEGGLDLSLNKAHQDSFQKTMDDDVESGGTDLDLTPCSYGDILPAELNGEPQMVLVRGDLIQISKQRQDGWAFGTKLHHANEVVSREMARLSTAGLTQADDPNVFTDTGWFQLEATRIPSAEDLKVLKESVGNTGVLEAPKEWEDVADPSLVELFPLPKGCDEYQSVVDAFTSTLKPPSFKKKYTIISVERVQNLSMWQSYVVKRQTICYRETNLRGDEQNTAEAAAIQKRALARFERSYLWHGTNADVMNKILQQGFNRSFCGKNATVYGKGVYFARDASYSASRSYSVPDDQGNQYILACRVVVGEYCPGTTDALTPDIRDPKTHALYDSTVGLLNDDNMSNPSIYVTYHDAQAYPCYAIKFRLE